MSIQEMQGESVADLLYRQRQEAIERTGREPSELVITSFQERQLRAEMEPHMDHYGPGETPADGIRFCGIPVRVIPMWENHGSAA